MGYFCFRPGPGFPEFVEFLVKREYQAVGAFLGEMRYGRIRKTQARICLMRERRHAR